MKDGHHRQRGQALILIVFSIIALVGITGLAVDGGNVYADRRQAQNAADAASLAGALARINAQAWVSASYAVAATNGYANDGKSSIVQIYSPPVSGPQKGNIEYIQVRITSHVRTYFAPVVGIPQSTNVVESVARSKPAEYRPMFGGAMAVSLASLSDCDKNKAFYVHSEATLDISGGGGIFVNSNNPTCALIQQAEGSLRVHDNQEIQVVGGSKIQKPDLLTPYPPIHVPAVSYPPPFYMPKVGCAQDAVVSEDGSSMSAGNWGDPFPPPGVTTLESGIYCLDGDFLMGGGKLSGGNVLIYMKWGQLHISGSADIELSGRNAGQFAGLLIYQPITNNHPMVLNGNGQSSYRGSILAPGAPIKIKGLASKYGFHSQIIGLTIDADGNNNVVMRYVEDENYLALYMPEVQFSK